MAGAPPAEEKGGKAAARKWRALCQRFMSENEEQIYQRCQEIVQQGDHKDVVKLLEMMGFQESGKPPETLDARPPQPMTMVFEGDRGGNGHGDRDG